MMTKRRLLNLYGFDYLSLQLSNPENSAQTLLDLLGCLYSDLKDTKVDFIPEGLVTKARMIKKVRKQAQYAGLLQIVKELGVSRDVLEVACGNGNFGRLLAENIDLRVVCADVNKELVEKARRKNSQKNLDYIAVDAMNSDIPGNWGLVLGLHPCGDLSNRVIDIAVQNNSDVLVVPCCYGKIQDKTPRSVHLADRHDKFQNALKKAVSLEGSLKEGKVTRSSIMLELARRLVDFDKIFYLTENGYDPSFVKITGDRVESNGHTYATSSLRSAIIGKKD